MKTTLKESTALNWRTGQRKNRCHPDFQRRTFMKIQLGFLVLLFVLISSSGYAMNMDVLEGREETHGTPSRKFP